ncbi:MAG TPA: hypothetical protein PLE45_11310 [Spirochaetota bacterium]|nr:hypothetical protein [Spirochaetota bacterium]HOL57743.1 hypothetical protein [Spirochaetota bacterium]HPP05338.1 hypothetical protein [Spirochaetota bacterium]
MSHVNIIAFYATNELDIKDIESEFFIENREKVSFFLFHNRGLNLTKSDIFKNCLLKELEKVEPVFTYKNDSLIMTKEIKNFDFEYFDNFVDKEYNDYLSKINYRIDCIFQTFDLFYRLYKDRNILFVIPMQIFHKFIEYFNKNNIKFQEVSKLNNIVRNYDALHWINYYSKKDINSPMGGTITYRNVIRIFIIEPYSG